MLRNAFIRIEKKLTLILKFITKSSFQTREENDSVFKKFICDQETRPEVGRKLSSLLITPVQRVPRYQLLVKEVLQHTPYEHREYRRLQGNLSLLLSYLSSNRYV